jgi:hypothetical protein
MTLNATSVVTATVGRLIRRETCAALRGSLDLAETAMPTQMDQAARSGGEHDLGEQLRALDERGCHARPREELHRGHEECED